MVYETIRKRMMENVPFAKHIGIQIESIGDGVAESRIELQPELLNHIQTAHAGVMFTLAEATSGGAMGGAIAPYMTAVRPVVSHASIEYVKKASTNLKAYGKTKDDPAELRETLKAEGKVVFDVSVSVRDEEGDEVVSMVSTWHISMKK